MKHVGGLIGADSGLDCAQDDTAPRNAPVVHELLNLPRQQCIRDGVRTALYGRKCEQAASRHPNLHCYPPGADVVGSMLRAAADAAHADQQGREGLGARQR